MRLDDHSHHSKQSAASSCDSKRTKRKEPRRKRDDHRKERRKSSRRSKSRSSSLSGLSEHSQSSDVASTSRRRRHSINSERRRRERLLSSSLADNRRKGLSSRHSCTDLTGLQHTNSSLQRPLGVGLRRSNTSPRLIDSTNIRGVVQEPQSSGNFDWEGEAGIMIGHNRSSISPMESHDRLGLAALERLKEDLMVRMDMLELKQENHMLKTRIERMEEGGIVVEKHTRESIASRREVSATSNEEPEYIYEKSKISKAKTKQRPLRTTWEKDSSGWTSEVREVRESSCFDFRNKKRNRAIAVGLLLAVAGGITGFILSHNSNNDGGYQPLTDDAPIFDNPIFPTSMKNDGI